MRCRGLLVLAFFCLASSAQGQSKLQPGALHDGFATCTLNFVYDGLGGNLGKVYLGTAAHCVEKVGGVVVDAEGEPFGTVAILGDPEVEEDDYAFIEIDPGHVSRVDPSVKGHPGIPTGVTTPDETSAGDVIQMSGYGMGFGASQTSQERRQGVLMSDTPERYDVYGPNSFGDSGGPFVHVETGHALGFFTRFGFGTIHTGNPGDSLRDSVGPTIQGTLARAAQKGFLVQLRPVGGKPPAGPPPPAPQPSPAPAPAAQPTAAPAPATAARPSSRPPARAKRSSKACKAKAKKIKNARKRKAALKRCAKPRQ